MALASVLFAGLILAGCGGSSSAEPLNKPQFIQEASAICRDADAERAEVLRNASSDQPGAAELTTEALPPVEEMIEELGELGPPAGDTKEVRAIIAAFEAGLKDLKANPADLTSAVSAFAEANQLAEDYGLADCTI
jgi:hypothetical protein